MSADEPVTRAEPVVSVRGLRVGFGGPGAPDVVAGVDLDVAAGECLAVVGESGAGKSVTGRALLGLAGPGARVRADRLQLAGRDVRELDERQWRAVRGRLAGLVSQDALVALDPLRTVGAEVAEALRNHERLDRAGRARRVGSLLELVHLPEPALRARQRPFQLSGGQRQRALIASGLAAGPVLLIADEPTTALDVTVQARILALLGERRDAGLGLLLITHDLAAVGRLADRVAVMLRGRIVETGPVGQVLTDPRHEYTRALLAAVPSAVSRPAAAGRPPGDAPALEARGVTKRYRGPDRVWRPALRGVSLTLRAGEALGILGESGSGKSTLASIALGLLEPDEGDVRVFGTPWSRRPERVRRPLRGRIQLIQQDALSAFDPRYRVERIIAEALPGAAGAPPRRERVARLLERVGLDVELLDRRPWELSGGQRQRVAIARALAPGPDLLVCDEPVSALDVSTQAQILRLFQAIRAEHGVALLFISHDLGVIRAVSDRVLVMRDGAVVEAGPVEEVFDRPREAYTRELLAAAAPAVPPPTVRTGP